MNTQNKVLSRVSLQSALHSLARPLVFTNGCFDILHRGHTTYLEQARNLGEALIVGVNSDASVKRQNKGADRPITALQDRLSVLASLECVDAVISFDEDTPLNLIMQVLPNHLVKGGDWNLNDIVGADVVRQAGGEVHSLEFEFDRSTTSLIDRIRES